MRLPVREDADDTVAVASYNYFSACWSKQWDGL